MTVSVPTKVLITVMTYPHPSEKYQELVCVAGITEKYEWVRLYPIDYRYRPKHQRFQKYHWIDVDLAPKGQGNDNRKESRKPALDTIRICSEVLSTKNKWEQRRAIIDRMPHYTINQLIEHYSTEKMSLGIVKPKRILDLKVTPANPQWKSEWNDLFKQLRLFGPPQKPLRKLPYKFQYVFECEDSKKPHCIMIEDWELGVLFLKESDRLGSDELAAKSVREKYFEKCAEKIKTHNSLWVPAFLIIHG